MTLSRLDGLNPCKLLGSTDWQLMFLPDATAIIAKMTFNAPNKRRSTVISDFPVLKLKVYFTAHTESLQCVKHVYSLCRSAGTLDKHQ